MKHCCPEELLKEILYEEKATEELKPEIKRVFRKKERQNNLH